MKLDKIEIRSFRSITNFTFSVNPAGLTTFCGVNNVGKTNVLRAINLFFAADISKFDADNDIPFHIERGSRGTTYKSEIIGTFIDSTDEVEITVSYIPAVRNIESQVKISGKRFLGGKRKAPVILTAEECRPILSSYKIFMVEANNFDLPQLISEIFVEEILPVLDKLKARQSNSLKDLNKFIESSEMILKKIESDLTSNLQSFTAEVEGIDLQNWRARIVFPEFTRLRQAISRLVSLTIQDANDKSLEFKGSGVQKIVLLALMRHLSNQGDKMIWLIDEPEAFLQPSLQREVYGELVKIAQSIPVIATTHSQYFVDIHNLDYTYLLTAEYSKKNYKRRPNQTFIATQTIYSDAKGYEKIEKIRHHLGLQRNDSWAVTPFNLLVEGEDDKNYIIALLTKLGIPLPNILVAGGATKIKGYLQFLQEFVEIPAGGVKTVVHCLLDHDDEGRKAFDSINAKTYNKLDVRKSYVKRFDGKMPHANSDFEFEDMLPTALLLEAANRYLKKRGYTKILEKSLSARSLPAYERTPVLELLNQLAGARNPHSAPIDFEHLGAKMHINVTICEMISKLSVEGLDKMMTDSPGLKDFIEEIKVALPPIA